jgi:hypothetical protein
MARAINGMRMEAGEILGAICDSEVALLVETFRKNANIMRNHEPRRFDGDTLIFVATEDKEVIRAEPGLVGSPARNWQPYVSGEISEIYLQYIHMEIIRPDVLAQVWAGISSWLGLEQEP